MPQELGFRMRGLSHQLRRLADKSPAKAQMEHVTGTHGWVIGYLYEHRNEEMRRSTATGILQLMEKNELITRESVRMDGRLKKLCLTPKALKLHESFGQDIRCIEAKMVNGIPEDELHAFEKTLEKMKNNLSAYEKELSEMEVCEKCK